MEEKSENKDKGKKDKKTTLIQVDKGVASKLASMRPLPRATYNDVIVRLIDEVVKSRKRIKELTDEINDLKKEKK